MKLNVYFIDFVAKTLIFGLLVAIFANIISDNTNINMVFAMSFYVCLWLYIAIYNQYKVIVNQFNYALYITTLLPYFSTIYGTGAINGILQILLLSIIIFNTHKPLYALLYGMVNITIIFAIGFYETKDHVLLIEYIVSSITIILACKIILHKQIETSILKSFLDKDICKLKINPITLELIDSANIFTILHIKHSDFALKLFLNSLRDEDSHFIKDNFYSKVQKKKTIKFNNRYLNCNICYINGGTLITLIDITSEEQINTNLKDFKDSINIDIHSEIRKPLELLGSYLEMITDTDDERLRNKILKSAYSSYLDTIICLEKDKEFKNKCKRKDGKNAR